MRCVFQSAMKKNKRLSGDAQDRAMNLQHFKSIMREEPNEKIQSQDNTLTSVAEPTEIVEKLGLSTSTGA